MTTSCFMIFMKYWHQSQTSPCLLEYRSVTTMTILKSLASISHKLFYFQQERENSFDRICFEKLAALFQLQCLWKIRHILIQIFWVMCSNTMCHSASRCLVTKELVIWIHSSISTNSFDYHFGSVDLSLKPMTQTSIWLVKATLL